MGTAEPAVPAASPGSSEADQEGRDAACKVLCDLLNAGDEVQRWAAARALGQIGASATVGSLIEALRDPDEDVRMAAAEALDRLGAEAAAPALLENLIQDPCGEVKAAAIAALASLRHAPAVPVLRRLALSRDEEIVWDDDEFYAGGWDDWLDIQMKAVEALGAFGEAEAASDIVAAMTDEMGQDLSVTGTAALAGLGDAGVDALAAFLGAPSARLRVYASGALGACEGEAATAALVGALSDSAAEVRTAALRALAHKDPSHPDLPRLLRDPDAAVRAEAFRLCPSSEEQRLSALLEDRSAAVKRAVLELMQRDETALAADGTAVRVLRFTVREGSETVAAAAAGVLAARAPSAALPELAARLADRAAPASVRAATAKAMGLLADPQAVEPLCGAVGEANREVRLAALAGLAMLAGRGGEAGASAEQALIAAVAGSLVPAETAPEPAETEPVAEAAPPEIAPAGDAETSGPTSTLGAILGDEAAAREMAVGTGEISADLADEDLALLELARQGPRKRVVDVEGDAPAADDVRRLAARLLGDLSGDETAAALLAAVDDADAELRRCAADSLARRAERGEMPAPAALDRLAGLLGESDSDLRIAALRILGAAGDAVWVSRIVGMLADDEPFVRAAAVRALAGLAAVGAEVADLLTDPQPSVRLAAAEALAGTGDRAWSAPLCEFLFATAGVHHREAARLLRRLDRPGAADAMRAALADDGRKAYWSTAADALAELYAADAAQPPEVMQA
ncbi:MAG: HEAT repeat domain-containing protein [Alphaproteobacteria bacterium]|nr:HEAT repeat domain-containing protein [Alphaproteobacteria bacterium]